jgi:RNA polymerase sigma-70 factor (ECF subfamily)
MTHRPLRQLNDSKLVQLCQAAGDADAFEELVRRHRAALTDFLTSSIRHRQDAEDLAQSALIKAFVHIGRYDSRSTFRTWLCAIGYRELLMLARRQRSHRRILDRLRGEVRPVVTKDPDWPIDIRTVVAELDPDERRLVMLCDVAGLTHVEAARLLDIPLGTFKSRIKRVRQRLSARLEPDREVPE